MKRQLLTYAALWLLVASAVAAGVLAGSSRLLTLLESIEYHVRTKR